MGWKIFLDLYFSIFVWCIYVIIKLWIDILYSNINFTLRIIEELFIIFLFYFTFLFITSFCFVLVIYICLCGDTCFSPKTILSISYKLFLTPELDLIVLEVNQNPSSLYLFSKVLKINVSHSIFLYSNSLPPPLFLSCNSCQFKCKLCLSCCVLLHCELVRDFGLTRRGNSYASDTCLSNE